MKKLSIAGKGYRSEEKVTGYYNAGDRMNYWGKDRNVSVIKSERGGPLSENDTCVLTGN
jgi:hypothetical protein